MRVFFDHNLSPALARALRELFRPEHEVVALREKFAPNISDVDWIDALNREGRWVVVSADRRIRKNRAEYLAFRSSRLIGMFLSAGLAKAPVTKQAERLIVLWPSMERVAETVGGGAMFELPMKSVRLEQMS
ncbi:hypothetical protein ACE7GA_21400 [Roseomonas sp. CCTCC AB2023176]|uniref:PIN-like domain-containing protein n=1 Tax=Roseomonas sp. CCTCC AB2023176 TaxID=3342640 RepID=UPI0035DF82E6